MNINVKDLSLEEKVGQKLMFGIDSKNIDIVIELIEKCYIGGVILYKKNYNSYDEMLDVIKKLKDANKDNKIPLFIAIDQEGGRVNRMPGEIKNLRNVYDMSKCNNDLIYDNAKITSKMLTDMGINMNFAPVLDIYDNDKNKVLYKRCFYGDKENVALCGRKYLVGANENGIISVLKHFPGHGATKRDSHLMTPYVSDSKIIMDKHMYPFNEVIKNGIDAIMVGHLVIKGMTGGVPASVSRKFNHKYLREQYNYDGLIITDEVNMLSRNLIYRFNYLNMAIFGGSDIVLIKVKKSGIKIVNKYLKLFKNNQEYMNELDESVERIIKIKEKYNINDFVDNLGIDIEEVNKEIDRINKLVND